MKKYRNEWKFVCTNSNLKLLDARIKGVLFIDSHAKNNGKYYVHSLYFDDYKNSCAIENDMGLSKRYKWRIRFYDNYEKKLFLEKKEKIYGRCHKKQCELSEFEYNKILNLDVLELFWKTEKKLLKEFCLAIINRQFKPKVIIDYERTAYIEEITNIRITLDTNITASYDFNNFTSGNYIKIPIQDINYHVLEVKFDYILPSYIRNIICSYGFSQTSFSKYYLGIKKIQEVLQ